MTYSRPSTRAVDALQSVGTPDSIEVKGDSNVQVSANGRVIDDRAPNQLIRNQEAKTAVMTNFIDSVTKAGTTLYKGYLEDQANDQIGNLLANTSPEDLLRSTTSNEQRDVIRNLNPIARDKVESMKAIYAANKYQEVYNANTEASRSLLTDPSRTEEQRAEARLAIQSVSREQAGLSLAAPRALAQLSDPLQEFEGQVAGKLYGDTLARKRDQDLSDVSNSLVSETVKLFTQNPEEVEIARKPLQMVINDNALMFTPEQQAKGFYDSLATTMGTLMQGDQYNQAQDVMRGLRNLQVAGIKTLSGSNFFDAKLPGGKTLGLALTELEAKVAQGSLQQQSREAESTAGEWGVLYGQAKNAEERQNIENRYMALVALAEKGQQRELILKFGQIKAEFDSPTEQQEINAANLRAQTLKPGYPEEKARAEWEAAQREDRITATQYARGSDALTSNDDKTYGFIDTAKRASVDIISLQVDALVEEGYRDGNNDGSTALQNEDPKTVRSKIESDLLGKTQIEIERRSREATESGNPWTQKMIVEEYRNEIKRQAEIMGEYFRQGKSSEDAPESQAKRTEKAFVEFANNIKDKKEDLTVLDFPKSIRQSWQRSNPKKTPTVKDLTKALTRQLELLKDEEGKPLVPDAKKRVRDALNKTNIGDRFNALLEFVVGSPQLNDENSSRRLREEREEKEKESDSKKKGDDQASVSPVYDGAKKFVSNGLGTIANVLFTPPANAGTLEDKPGVLNSDQLEAFAKAMKSRKTISAKTPPLPQVTASSPVQRLPIAIANVNHPLFIAIGIAEGTRTASGAKTKNYYGHTDIGDGNLNVGTVSGGRNGGTPQQVDRQWMGILTSVSTTMAPKLQALGLRPNSQGWNRLMFNILDLRVQAAPAALTSFVMQVPKLIRQGLTVEAIAKARADSFINPATGRLEASGFNNNYSRLLADQRSRAGVYDYKRRF